MRWLLIGFAVLFSITQPASAFDHGIAPATFTPSWQALSIGGGGEANNLYSLSDGKVLVSANTMGAYLRLNSGTCAGADNGGWGTDRAAPCYQQLFTQTSAPLTLTQIINLNQGVNEIDGCPSNVNDAYALYDKTLWFTTNLEAAATLPSSLRWTPTSLTTTDSGNQGVSNGTAHIIVCDPNNPQIVYVSTPAAVKASGNGLNGGATFATVTGIGTIGTVPDVLAYDGSSGASVGTCSQFSGSPSCTLHFLIFVDGAGVYETYNGGSSYTLTSSGPVTSQHQCEGGYCFSLKADQFGNFWAAIGDTHLYKYVPNGTAGGGTWSSLTPNVNHGEVGEFALDQTSSSSSTLRIVASWGDGNISVSTNGGSTWCAWSNQPFTASGAQPPWFGNANQGQASNSYLAAKDFAFDASGNLRIAGGIGVWLITSANVTCGATYLADSIGIENLVTNHIDAPLGNWLVVATWDRAFWSLTNPDAYPSDYWPDYTYSNSYGPINAGWVFDWASGNTNFFTGWATNDNTVPATTPNGGAAWSIWASLSLGTTNLGGDIAASTALNWVVVPAGASGNLQYTTDGGNTFHAATTTGMSLPISAQEGSGFHIAADRGNANTFCLIDNNEDLWASVNSGATWSKSSTALESAGIKYNDALKAVPGQAGTYYYSGGNAGGSVTTYHLWKITKTTNECDTVVDVNSNITNIFGFGYGAPLPGGNGTPTIYLYGAVSNATISSGTYNTSTGIVSLTLSAPASFSGAASVAISALTGTGAGLGSLDGSFIAASVSGTTVTYNAGAGLGSITITGGMLSLNGIYEIDNGGTTPALISAPSAAQTWPNNSGDYIKDVSGDMNVYGRVYVGMAGSGLAYIDTQNACPAAEWTSTAPNAALTGTVTLTAAHSGKVPVSSVVFQVDGSTIASFTGNGPYTYSWATSGVAHGSHTLTVITTGNCSTSGSFTIPITTSFLLNRDLMPLNDNDPAFLAQAA